MVQGYHHIPLHHWASPLILTPPVPSVAHTKDTSSQSQGVIARGMWGQGSQSCEMLKTR